jgi:hypothetical protein
LVEGAVCNTVPSSAIAWFPRQRHGGVSQIPTRMSRKRIRFSGPGWALIGRRHGGSSTVGGVSAVLKPCSPIREATVLNPALPRELPRDRSVVLDIRLLLDDGRQVDVEMQVQVRKDATERDYCQGSGFTAHFG